MTEIKKIFSFKELKNVRTLAVCALMIALNVVLSVIAEIPLFDRTIMIGFQYLALVVVGYLYGPMPAMIVGGIGDILGAFLFPKGAPFIGFTLNAMVEGFVYGLFFYKKKITLGRIMSAMLVNLVVISFMMTPTWIQIMYSTNMWITKALYVSKIGKYPVDVLLTFFLLKSLDKAKVLKR